MAEENVASTIQSTGETTPTIRGTSILDQLGINAADVLKAPNIASTLTSPAAPITDALGIFTAQEEAQGIPELKAAYQTAQQNFLNAQNLANQEQLTIQGRAKKLGVLRGEQAQAAGQANVDLQTLQTAQNLAGSALSSAQATAQQRASILYDEYQTKNNLLLQYPGLKINPLTDTFDTVSSKLKEYQKEQEKDAEKKAYKAALRELGLSTSGSRKELEKRLAKANKSALEAAKEDAALDRKAKEVSIQNTLSEIANRNANNQTFNTNSVASLYGDNSNSGGLSIGSNGITATSSNEMDNYLNQFKPNGQ